MKKRFLFILSAICAMSLALCISCGKTGDSESESNGNTEVGQKYSIEGVSDIAISSNATEYDFLKGIVGWEDQTIREVTVDSSAVEFGKVGSYEIVYTLNSINKKAIVRVYGMPEIVGETKYEASFSEDIDVFAGVIGKDSFGAELLVATNSEFELDKFGRVCYGDHFFRYYVTDAVGNTAYLDRIFTVTPPLDYVFEDVIVTVENPNAKIDIGEKELSYIVYNDEKLEASAYTVKDGILDLSYYAVDLGVGRHTFSLSFAGGYSDVVVDMGISAAQFYSKAIVGEEMASFFKPYSDGASYGNHVYWDEEEGAYHFVNNVTVQYDNRGFYMDSTYFNNIIEKGGATKMTFNLKFEATGEEDTEVTDLAFYLGFIPEWFNKPGMQQIRHAEGYISVTIDLSKVEYVDGAYKTLFLLSTVSGFYIKDIHFEISNANDVQK